jgi:hypothetical protein
LKARIRDLGESLDAHRKRVQADHPDVTLTGMYNALERLRGIESEGGPALTDKERAFHEKALIGVLKQIHDELDAAVAEAYGWPVDLPDEEILARLVALNHERAEEEKRGLIRWLRPEFQNPGGVQTQTAFAAIPTDSSASPQNDSAPASSPAPWPKSTGDQLKAVRDLLAATPGSLSMEEVAASFKNARKASVLKHLEVIEALGMVVSHEAAGIRRWSARR